MEGVFLKSNSATKEMIVVTYLMNLIAVSRSMNPMFKIFRIQFNFNIKMFFLYQAR